jgi:flagellar hook-length control protein FliK
VSDAAATVAGAPVRGSAASADASASGDFAAAVGAARAASAASGASPGTDTGTTPLPGVSSQIVSVLAPLRTSAGGTQTVTIVLHPDELGDVRATITVSGDQTTVRLVASTSEATSALRASLPDLQSGLSSDGQRSTILLGDPGSNGSTAEHEAQDGAAYEAGTPGAPSGPSPGAALSVGMRAPAIAGSATHHLLDVRI